MNLGESAEIVSKLWRLTRVEQDALSVNSHCKAGRARAMGLLAEEIVGISLPSGEMVDEDGCIRPDTTMESLAALEPLYRQGGLVTAGTSSPFAGGASAVLVMDEAFAERHDLEPLARIAACGSSGVDPALMGIAPVSAARRALFRTGIVSSELDVVELSETFSSHALAFMRDLELDPIRVNIDGGALALGLPLGAAGAHIAGKAAALLARTGGRYALAAQPIAGGQGIATLLERA